MAELDAFQLTITVEDFHRQLVELIDQDYENSSQLIKLKPIDRLIVWEILKRFWDDKNLKVYPNQTQDIYEIDEILFSLDICVESNGQILLSEIGQYRIILTYGMAQNELEIYTKPFEQSQRRLKQAEKLDSRMGLLKKLVMLLNNLKLVR